MRKICLAVLALCSMTAAANAWEMNGRADWAAQQSAPGMRFAALHTLLAPPAGAMYSLGGYAPAGPAAYNAAPGPDYTELASPMCNGCGGMWDGYQARPCNHRHHWPVRRQGWGGWSSSCGCGGGNWGGGCGTGWSGGWTGGGCGAACAAPASACDTCGPAPCRRHHCHLFGKHRGCSQPATVCDSCQGGMIDGQSMPAGQQGGPEEIQSAPTPAPEPQLPEAPGPSARRKLRDLWYQASVRGPVLPNN